MIKINNNKPKLLKISFIILCYVLSIILIYSGDILSGVIAMAILVGIAWVYTNMDLLHPLTWFPPIFFMYSVSFPILVLFGEESYVVGLNNTLFLEWLALFIFIIFMGIPRKIKKAHDPDVLNNIRFIVQPVFIFSVLMSSVYLLYIYRNGLSSKYAITLDNSIYSNLEPFFSIFVLSYLILFIAHLIKKQRIPKILMVFGFGFAFLILIIAGERDIILRITIGILMAIYFLYKQIKKRYLFIIGILGVLSISILNNLKNFVFGERIVDDTRSLIVDIFGGEFKSASRNLTTLINNQEKWDFFYGETIIWDLKIATFFNSTSPGAWFNQTFYPSLVSQGGGNGYSIVAEGYMNFGILGVIFWFAFLALFLNYIYKKAYKGYIWTTIYIAFIPIVIYAIRGDLATILTHFNKHIVLPLLIIYFMKMILEKRRLSNKKIYNYGDLPKEFIHSNKL